MELLPILDFIEFSLLPYLSHKEIQLIQLKITQARPKKQSRSDTLYLECFYYQKAIQLIRKYKKNAPHSPQGSALSIYSSLTKLDPEELLLVLSETRYPVSADALTLILGKPIESLKFRKDQIIHAYQAEGLGAELDKIKSLSLSDLNYISSSPSLKVKLSKLSQLPSPIRFILEMGGVIVLLFFIMWLVPQVRNTYENSVQKRINEYLIDASLTDSPPPEGLIKPQVIQQEPDPPPLTSQDESVTPTIESPTHKQPKVNEGETWRFSFTGQGQSDLDAQINGILESKTKQKIKPLVVPGGVQFEFFLHTNEVISLKSEFEQLTASIQKKSSLQTPNHSMPIGVVNMSWYKKRNLGSRKIPSGNVLVIVWISTL